MIRQASTHPECPPAPKAFGVLAHSRRSDGSSPLRFHTRVRSREALLVLVSGRRSTLSYGWPAEFYQIYEPAVRVSNPRIPPWKQVQAARFGPVAQADSFPKSRPAVRAWGRCAALPGGDEVAGGQGEEVEGGCAGVPKLPLSAIFTISDAF